MENPTKMDDLRVPLFQEPPISDKTEQCQSVPGGSKTAAAKQEEEFHVNPATFIRIIPFLWDTPHSSCNQSLIYSHHFPRLLLSSVFDIDVPVLLSELSKKRGQPPSTINRPDLPLYSSAKKDKSCFPLGFPMLLPKKNPSFSPHFPMISHGLSKARPRRGAAHFAGCRLLSGPGSGWPSTGQDDGRWRRGRGVR